MKDQRTDRDEERWRKQGNRWGKTALLPSSVDFKSSWCVTQSSFLKLFEPQLQWQVPIFLKHRHTSIQISATAIPEDVHLRLSLGNIYLRVPAPPTGTKRDIVHLMSEFLGWLEMKYNEEKGLNGSFVYFSCLLLDHGAKQRVNLVSLEKLCLFNISKWW